MDSSGTAPSTSNKSSPGDGSKPNKASRKRTIAEPSKKKVKKQRNARGSRPAQLGYTVQQGEDMLFVISSTTEYALSAQKKGNKKRKLSKGKGKAVKRRKTVHVKPKLENNPASKEDANSFLAQTTEDNRWGENLPEEVLISIFQMVLVEDGALPFLCRMGRVCRLWNAAASSPILWRRVTISYCWITPGEIQSSKMEKRIKDTFNWLAQNRFTQLQDFSLCHWTKNANYAVEVVAEACPHLRSLTLSYCTGLRSSAFESLGLHSKSLQTINLQFSEFHLDGLLDYLQNHGRQIKQILFTHGLKNNKLMNAITSGCCPDLELLEVNTKLDSKSCELPVCIPTLQVACPKLKTFRMLNVRPRYRTMRNAARSMLGFPLLEELCMATTSFSFMTDRDLWEILFGSPRLRVLDLRGCSQITPSGLVALPCNELECLFWTKYYGSVGFTAPKTGIHMVTQKWSQTLQQVDLGNQFFTSEDLELAMSYLTQAAEADTLRSLNLSGTSITPAALRSVIGHLTALNYLNISSCRYLPRGVKRIYRGQEDIRQLLDKLD